MSHRQSASSASSPSLTPDAEGISSSLSDLSGGSQTYYQPNAGQEHLQDEHHGTQPPSSKVQTTTERNSERLTGHYCCCAPSAFRRLASIQGAAYGGPPTQHLTTVHWELLAMMDHENLKPCLLAVVELMCGTQLVTIEVKGDLKEVRYVDDERPPDDNHIEFSLEASTRYDVHLFMEKMRDTIVTIWPESSSLTAWYHEESIQRLKDTSISVALDKIRACKREGIFELCAPENAKVESAIVEILRPWFQCFASVKKQRDSMRFGNQTYHSFSGIETGWDLNSINLLLEACQE